MSGWVYAVIGLAGGVLAGMGLGGGTLLIPLLTLICGVAQKDAQGVNLVAFLPAAALALVSHVKEKRVDMPSAKRLIGFGLLGALPGTLLALLALSDEWLRRAFGGFIVVLGVIQLIRGEKANKEKRDAEGGASCKGKTPK